MRNFRLLMLVLLLVFTSELSALNKTSPLFTTDIKQLSSGEFLTTNKGTKDLRLYNSSFSKLLKTLIFEQVPTGVAQAGDHYYVTSFENKGMLHKVNAKTFEIEAEIELQSGAMSPVLSHDNKTLYVANQFANTIQKIDLVEFKVVFEIAVEREPKCFVISDDEKLMFVANFLPAQRADLKHVASDVSVVDLSSGKVIKNIKLANGANALRGIALSSDGDYVIVSHNFGRFYNITYKIKGGWMNTSALSVINTRTLDYVGVVVLDEMDKGAGGAEKIAVNDTQIVVAHSGSHELSIIEYKPFIEKLVAYEDKTKLDFDLDFLTGMRERLPLAGNGPRLVLVDKDKAYVPTYFSDTLNVVDLKATTINKTIALQPKRVMNEEHLGEMIFNDARYCFEQWQSCNGCHPGDARHDGMNWDLMNDGPGNAKSCKSLLYSYMTPPSMITGIRVSADVATRKGFEHTQFHYISDYDAMLVDIYLFNLTPVPSPYLVNGQLSDKAKKGKKVFDELGCANCHSGEYYTDYSMHRIGDEKDFEKQDGWDTPTLKEVWRTAPYLFDGRAQTMRDVFEEFKHGVYKQISQDDITNLTEFVNSL